MTSWMLQIMGACMPAMGKIDRRDTDREKERQEIEREREKKEKEKERERDIYI